MGCLIGSQASSKLVVFPSQPPESWSYKVGHCAWQNQFSLWTILLLRGGGRHFPLGKRATCTGFLPGPSNALMVATVYSCSMCPLERWPVLMAVYIKKVCLLCDPHSSWWEHLVYVRLAPAVINCTGPLYSHDPSEIQTWRLFIPSQSTGLFIWDKYLGQSVFF